MKKATLTAILICSAPLANAQIYKCTDEDGKLHYSDKPCAKDAETVQIEDNTSGVSLGKSGDWSKVNESIRAREIERAIDRHQDSIRRLQNARDRELATLRAKQRRAANNLAGATYRQSLATEMQAVSEDYNSRISMEREAIQDLRAQR